MDSPLVNYYAREADKKERDPYGPDGGGRATVVNGRGFQMWRRFNPSEELMWVDDADGNPRALTPKQYMTYQYVSSHLDVPGLKIMDIAAALKVSSSTISRALVKLASFGLIAYITGRGRYAGTLIWKRVKGDDHDRFRRAAKDKVRSWAKAAERRVSRLQVNLAPYLHEKERGVDSLYYYLTSITSTKGARLNEEWRSDELVDIV